jgi:hypothetical protein
MGITRAIEIFQDLISQMREDDAPPPPSADVH